MTEYREPSFPAIFREADFLDAKTMIRKLLQVLSEWESLIKAILDHGISFDDNLDCVFVDFTFGATPDTEEVVAHGLGKEPTGYIVIQKDRAVDVYDGGTAHTLTDLNLKATVADAVVKLLVF